MNYENHKKQYKEIQNRASGKKKFVTGVVKTITKQIAEIIVNDLMEIETDGIFRYDPEVKYAYDGEVGEFGWSVEYIDLRLENRHNGNITLFYVGYDRWKGLEMEWFLWDTREWTASRNAEIMSKILEKLAEKNTLIRIGQLVLQDSQNIKNLIVTEEDKIKQNADLDNVRVQLFQDIQKHLYDGNIFSFDNTEYNFTYGNKKIIASNFSFTKNPNKNNGSLKFYDHTETEIGHWENVNISSLYRILRELVFYLLRE